ncbi:cytochrome b-c1 complex subunit 8-like [Rhagoletis pomonella]|uniref:cytochrome b-c1 complex subunit 8-like n=1 Tax=Rhagoletis pomonella TaxID=28610 RepID=UPI00177D99DC|nr:cytochrome b-c1 complex subunit 8-like [Rhagoletis pomonella]XP_036335836.1 cytochrome b-c1 complex subunit 8-like [Rhagoletis pomonella]XP_036335837.1 cytochrome b-c1 complex subunit 8-like [Rhagoletis pomonella]
MRVTSSLLGAHFGNLAKVHGIVTYKLSPFEQRAFAGAISKGLPNIFRRIRSHIFIVTPPFIVGYLIYDLTEREHHHLTRKNPKEFENDE